MNPSSTSAQALQQLQQFNSGAKNPEQALTDAQGALGVSQAQAQVQGLRGAIQNTTNLLGQVAPGVMGRTQNSLVTTAQANRQIQNEQAPIQADLSRDTDAYNTASTDYGNLEKQAEARANLALTGQQSQQSYLQQIYTDLYKQEQDTQDRAAAAKAAASSSSGLSSLFGGGSDAGTAKVADLGVDKFASIPGVVDQIKILRNQPGGVQKWNWGALEAEFRNRGIDVSHGSIADRALNQYFAAGNADPIINARNPGLTAAFSTPKPIANAGNSLLTALKSLF